MAKYNIHKDFSFLRFVPNMKKWTISPLNSFSRWLFKSTKAPNTIDVQSHQIKGYEDKDIEVVVFKPKNIQANAPCLVYCHGGGFFFEAVQPHKKVMYEYAEKANCIIVFPHYRVSLNNPFPTSLEDCYSALKWANDNAAMLGIDKNKMAIGGDSAGGSLAACTAQMALDRQEINLCFQLLIYPVCDHTMSTASMKEFQDTPLWNAPSSKLMWDVYLKGMDRNNLPKYASALQRTDLKGLPPTYIESAEFDCLRDEAILYAQKLKASNIQVELNETKGTIHAFDIVEKSSITKDSIQRRVRALRQAFGGQK
ncbi:MAG: alpha/beta hydrolase [Chitinophagales bacterium]|nr:alpha/beta hydrolase [Chitinophagales bacterium]